MANYDQDSAAPGAADDECCCDPADLVPTLGTGRSIPPFVATGVEMFSFPVGASFAKLQTICDDILNAPTLNAPAPNAQQWRPLGPMFYIQVLKYDKLVSEDYADLGFISQNELVFQIPIIPLNALLPTIGFFSAYLVVDNPLSLTVGREVFGYPKTYGSFQLQANQIEISNWLTPGSGPGQKYAEHPLLRQTGLAKLTSFAQDQRSSLWPLGPVEELFRPKDYDQQEGKEPPPFELDAFAWSMLFDSSAVPILHSTHSVQALKQIDSMTLLNPGPQKAAYQARVSATATQTNLMGSGLLASDPLTIHQYVPLDLIDIFGITTVFGSVPVFFPFWLDVDFTVHDPTLLTCGCYRG